MYIKVYIYGMEMSLENPFSISNFSKNDDFLREWQKKNTFLVKNCFLQTNKKSFELKMPKFLENHVKTHV